MEDRALVVRSWALKMGLPNRELPSDAALRNLFSGQGKDIWDYVSRHIFPKEKVKVVKGNLDWNRCTQRAANSSSEEQEKKRLMDLVISLRADIQVLDSACDSEQLDIDERSLTQARDRLRDLKQRDVLLKAYRLQTADRRRSLQEHGVKVHNRLRTLTNLGSKARQEVGLLWPRDGLRRSAWHRTGPEPPVLRDLRGACYSRFQFLKSLYDEQNVTVEGGRDGGGDRRSAMYQQWLNQVEGAISSHAPKHILVALESLAAENEEELLELSSKVNVVKDMEELRFAYTSSHLQDVSEAPPALRSVKSLLEEGWRDCELRVVQKIGAVRRQTELTCRLLTLGRELQLLLEERYGHSPELLRLSREVFELQLDVVERKRHCQELVEQAHLLTNSIVARNREIYSLQQKHNRILDFQGLVDVKQDLIRALVRGNSSAKSHLMTTQTEIVSFMDSELQQHKDAVCCLTDQLRNSVSKEVRLFASISLPRLDRRIVQESQRVPVQALSIHRMDNSTDDPHFRRLKNMLSFPLYKAPEHLIDEAAERRLELVVLRMLLEYQKGEVESLRRHRDAVTLSDVGALVERVREHDERCIKELVPAIRQNLEKVNQAMEFTNEFRQEVQDWWEQPAQFLVPWVKKNEMSVQAWIRRWNQLVQRSAALSQDQGRRRPPQRDPAHAATCP